MRVNATTSVEKGWWERLGDGIEKASTSLATGFNRLITDPIGFIDDQYTIFDRAWDKSFEGGG